MRIGIAGVGKMGTAIALRLLEVGQEVWVWNRTAAKVEPLRPAGAQVAASAAALADAVEVIITVVSNAAAQNGTYDGAAGVLAGNVAGKLVIDMSTVQPAHAQALAHKVRAMGATFVECPVGGTTGPARQGKLLGLAGGQVADIARAQPILAQLCRRLEHVGPVGAGASMKLAINLPLIVYWQALGEALALIKHLNLDPTRAMDILADTSGAPSMMKNRAPAVAAALAGKDNSPTATIDTLKKDLAEMVAEAKSRGYDAPATRAALAGFERASRAGLGAKDCTAVPVSWLRSGTGA